MTTSPNPQYPTETEQTQRNRTPLLIILGIVIVAAALIVAGVVSYNNGYAAKAAEPVVASQAKMDTATKQTTPNCDEGQAVYSIQPNRTAEVLDADGNWVKTDAITATGTYDSYGTIGDILVSAKLKDGKPVAKVAKTYAWNFNRDDKGRAGWTVIRYITPEPTGLLIIKDSHLVGYGRLMACVAAG